MRAGRARWKIENETFNTLKNQGYEFEHNFGHGDKNLCNNLAILMMVAFLMDQVQQFCCKVFGKLLSLAKRKTYLWKKMQAVFLLIPSKSFTDFYLKVGKTYDKSFVIDSA